MLDCGCGSGWLSHMCRRRGARVTAMDIAPAGVAAAKARFPGAAEFHVADVYHLPFDEESFECVILSEVLEHLEDIELALGEIHRILQRGGRLLISVPYREKILEHLCIHCNRFTPAHAHLHSFDKQALARILTASGFEIQRTRFLTNKLLELARFSVWGSWLPHFGWRAVDGLLNVITGKPAFICIVAKKVDLL